MLQVRGARLDDVERIRDLISGYAELGVMLFRSLADIYESVRDFKLAELDGKVVGCCALAIVWGDLAEVRSLVVAQEHQGEGIGAALVKGCLAEAQQLRLPRVFTLTLEPDFFSRLGFEKVGKEALPMKVWSDCVRCPKQDCCDEIAMVYHVTDSTA